MISIDLKLEDISRDDAYDLSFPPCPQRHAAIGNKFPGLPLVIVDMEKRLVWGHDSFRFLLGSGQKSAGCLQIDIAPAAALFLNYNLSNRLFGLNLVEKLLFVKKISGLCPRTEIQSRADLDFTLNDELFQRLDGLLSDPLRPALAAGKLGLKAALHLLDLAEADRLALLAVFQSCGFSESQQRLVAQMLEEIAFREKKPLSALLAADALGSQLTGEMPQKKFLAALHGRRYPAWELREREWRAWQKKMTAGGGLSLAHAPFFAREEVQVTLTVKNPGQAEKLLAGLKKIL